MQDAEDSHVSPRSMEVKKVMGLKQQDVQFLGSAAAYHLRKAVIPHVGRNPARFQMEHTVVKGQMIKVV